jgi:hypothetical protein
METRWIVLALIGLLAVLLLVVLKPSASASQALTAQRGPRTDTAAMTRGEMAWSGLQHLVAAALALGGAMFLARREGWTTLDPRSLQEVDPAIAFEANAVAAGAVLALLVLASIITLAALVLLLHALVRRRHKLPAGSVPGARRPYGG